jgi:hypothetical protein
MGLLYHQGRAVWAAVNRVAFGYRHRYIRVAVDLFRSKLVAPHRSTRFAGASVARAVSTAFLGDCAPTSVL